MIIAATTQAVLLVLIFLLAGMVVYLILDRRVLRASSSKEAQTGASDSLFKEISELKEQLSAFDQAMAQCPSSIIITDLEGNIQYVNAQFTEVSEYSSEEVIGRNPSFLKSGNMDPEVYADLWKTLSQGQVWRGDLENRKKSGQIYWEHVSISPIKNAGGEVLRYFAVKENITEGKLREADAHHARMEAETAEAADQAKAVFLKVIGQEMKNPLNRILGFTNLLSQSKLTNDQLKHLNQVGSAGLDLLTLIDRILDFTKAETGTIELETRPFKPIDVLQSLLNTYEQKAAERKIVLKREISDTLPDYVIGDARRFREVLEPLLDNAVKYTFEGSITVRMDSTYNQSTKIWEFQGEVRDTGRGFQADKLEELFKPFTQLEPRSEEGPGLGLALCQRLCQIQGGALRANSVLDEGSSFRFDLKYKPMDIDHAAVQLARGPEGKQFARTYPIDILVAEDNRINRRLLETLMERLGYQASFAMDGLGVLAEVRKRPYHLILMDLQMPNMSGIEAARRIRDGELGKEVKNTRIVALTAFTTEENITASQAVGMDAILTKPFDIAKIKLEIIHAYQGGKAREEKVS